VLKDGKLSASFGRTEGLRGGVEKSAGTSDTSPCPAE